MQVDISYFNQDNKQNSATCKKMQKNRKLFSQLLVALTWV